MELISTDAGVLDDLDAHISRSITEMLDTLPQPQDGTIVGGSYDPSTGSAEMLFGDTYCILGDDGPPGDAYINHQKLNLLTTQVGDLYGPTGVERTVAIPTPTGYGLLYKHSHDDSPQPPAGERWILHKTVATQTLPAAEYDGGALFTNDGPTAGDGLGGTRIGNQGALTQQVTASGHQVTLNDTDQTITTQTAGGQTDVFNDETTTIVRTVTDGTVLSMNGSGAAENPQSIITQGAAGVKTIVDGAGNAISHVVPRGGLIGLGGIAGGMAAGTAAVNQDLMNNSYSDLVNTASLTNLQAYITALTTSLGAGGLPNPSAFSSSMIAIIVGSWLAKVGSFTGSQTVRIAP